MRPSALASDPLRLVLLAGGAGTLVVGAAWALATHASASPRHIGVLATAIVAILVALPPRLPGRALLATIVAIASYLLATWASPEVTFPSLDLVRPWGLEKDAWPVFRPMLGLLLLAFALPAGLAGHRGARVVGLVGCGVLLAYLAIPRWYEMDVVEEAGLLPELVEAARGPGAIGPGDTPIVRDGELQHVHWTKYLWQGAPGRVMPHVAYRERVVADLAQGLNAELARTRGASGAETGARSALWTVAKAASTVRLTAELVSAPLWLWAIVRLGLGRAGRTERRVLGGSVLAQLLWVPVWNGVLTLASVALLPEGAWGAGWAVAAAAGVAGATAVAALAGRSLARA